MTENFQYWVTCTDKSWPSKGISKMIYPCHDMTEAIACERALNERSSLKNINIRQGKKPYYSPSRYDASYRSYADTQLVTGYERDKRLEKQAQKDAQTYQYFERANMLKSLGAYPVTTDDRYNNPVSGLGLAGNDVVINLLTGEISITEALQAELSENEYEWPYDLSEILEEITSNSGLIHEDGNNVMMLSADVLFFGHYEDDGTLKIEENSPIWYYSYVMEDLRMRLASYGKANLSIAWD